MPKKSKISRQPSIAMTERPALAVYIARIAVAWSRVEERLGHVVVQLLGAHAHTGAKMYQALSGSATRKAVLRAVARDRLDKPMLEELEGILDDFKKVGGRRNDVIHGQWELSEDHPDELVWYDGNEYMISNSEFWAGYHARPDQQEMLDWARGFKGTPIKYFLYGKQDFEELIERIRQLLFRIQNFTLSLHKIHKPRGDESSLRS